MSYSVNIAKAGNDFSYFDSGDVGGNFGTTGSVKNIYVVKEPDVISGDGTLNLLAKVHYK